MYSDINILLDDCARRSTYLSQRSSFSQGIQLKAVKIIQYYLLWGNSERVQNVSFGHSHCPVSTQGFAKQQSFLPCRQF